MRTAPFGGAGKGSVERERSERGGEGPSARFFRFWHTTNNFDFFGATALRAHPIASAAAMEAALDELNGQLADLGCV